MKTKHLTLTLAALLALVVGGGISQAGPFEQYLPVINEIEASAQNLRYNCPAPNSDSSASDQLRFHRTVIDFESEATKLVRNYKAGRGLPVLKSDRDALVMAGQRVWRSAETQAGGIARVDPNCAAGIRRCYAAIQALNYSIQEYEQTQENAAGGGNPGGGAADPGTTDPGTTDPGCTGAGTTGPGCIGSQIGCLIEQAIRNR